MALPLHHRLCRDDACDRLLVIFYLFNFAGLLNSYLRKMNCISGSERGDGPHGRLVLLHIVWLVVRLSQQGELANVVWNL